MEYIYCFICSKNCLQHYNYLHFVSVYQFDFGGKNAFSAFFRIESLLVQVLWRINKL